MLTEMCIMYCILTLWDAVMQKVLSYLKYLACSHGCITGHRWCNERIEYL